MKLKELGEFGLIDRLKRKLKSDRSVLHSIGDDAAVIKYTKDEYLLFASDMLVEDVDFKITGDKELFAKIGHKALACNISDIAAMGGEPKYVLVNLGLRADLPAEKVFEIFSGIEKTARKFGISVVGGDLSSAEKIIISISIIGFVEKKFLTLRSTAKSGDVIFVTGALGGSGRGSHLTFTPRLKEARYLVSKYKINSMLDISDGLVQDLSHILRASGKGAVLYKEKIPVSPSAKDINSALYEGEDFELLFTASETAAEKLAKDKNLKIFRIGEILGDKKKFTMVDKKGFSVKLKPKGFRHF